MGEAKSNRNWRLNDMHHLGLTVSDIEQSIHFYQDLLGLVLTGRRPSVTADYISNQTGYDELELNVASFKVNADSKQSMEVVQYMNNTGKPTACMRTRREPSPRERFIESTVSTTS